MAAIYDRNPATIVVTQKGLLSLRKTQDRDMQECPHLVFTHDQALSLWETFVEANEPISGIALSLYGKELNAQGTYPAPLKAAETSQRQTQDGRDYLRNEAWAPKQLKAFDPVLVQLEYGIFKGPHLCAYLVAPVKRAAATKARVIPAITRIDVGSPQGKEIAARHAAPAIKRVNRR